MTVIRLFQVTKGGTTAEIRKQVTDAGLEPASIADGWSLLCALTDGEVSYANPDIEAIINDTCIAGCVSILVLPADGECEMLELYMTDSIDDDPDIDNLHGYEVDPHDPPSGFVLVK